MAKTDISVAFDNTSDASYRAWVNHVHNAILACGWEVHTITGEFNLTTGTRLSAWMGNPRCYKTPAATGLPVIYLTVYYATANGTTYPGMGVEAGFAVNANGVHTGVRRTGHFAFIIGANNVANPVRVGWISGDAHRIAFVLAQDETFANTTQVAFSFERLWAADGSPSQTEPGLQFFHFCPTTGLNWGGGNANAGSGTPSNSNGALAVRSDTDTVAAYDQRVAAPLASPATSTSTTGTITGAEPCFAHYGRSLRPSKNVMGALVNDASAFATVTLNDAYGTSAAWKVLSANHTQSIGVGNASATVSRPLFRYD